MEWWWAEWWWAERCVGGAVVGPAVGGVVWVTEPVQVVPLTANVVGTGLLPVQVPLKPNETLALVATPPFQAALTARTCVPLCVTSAFQPWATCWPPANDQVRVQPASGSPRLVRLTFAVKPVFHCEAMVYVARQPAAAALATYPVAAVAPATAITVMPASRAVRLRLGVRRRLRRREEGRVVCIRDSRRDDTAAPGATTPVDAMRR